MVWDGVTPLMTIRDGKPEYFLHDHLGSVRAQVGADGQISRYLDYDPFGTLVTKDGPEAVGSAQRLSCRDISMITPEIPRAT
jgi:uncharacterized protein RhaS with RHS repeats